MTPALLISRFSGRSPQRSAKARIDLKLERSSIDQLALDRLLRLVDLGDGGLGQIRLARGDDHLRAGLGQGAAVSTRCRWPRR
jgi:hypothetical protein